MIASVVIDVPARAIDRAFDYAVPERLRERLAVGVPVHVGFAGRRAVGYVVALPESTGFGGELKAIDEVLGPPLFDAAHARLAEWIAARYLCPLSEALRLMLPPGGTPKVRRVEDAEGVRWELQRPAVGAVDDRWAELTGQAPSTPLRPTAVLQRAVLDALAEGPVRVTELAAELGSVDASLKRLEGLGAVRIERRRRYRMPEVREKAARRYATLSEGQTDALEAIRGAYGTGRVVLVDGVTGSGKTEVYLRAIEQVLAENGGAVVLVPEISLTPQTVGRFRSRFGEQVAVLHSRLSAGERYDQWELVATGEARVVVGARSALFAPVRDLRLVVIDEEHESSYKQSSAPRYHARDAAAELCAATGAALVLGSATPSLESLEQCERGGWARVEMPERVAGGSLPDVQVVDMGAEFGDGHRSMFSRPLIAGLTSAMERGEKAVLFLNRRGFASFLLCRECGYVPRCDSCAVSLTYHDVGSALVCHHCGIRAQVPAKCPKCGSVYLRQFGAGTQRVEAELHALLPDVPVVRMDADTTTGKGAHDRLLAAFEALDSGILLGTQMVAKGLDYPEVTVVGVVNADTTLHLPDFRSGERTYQLLEQVAGRAGRGERPGSVFIQTYWPDHPAILAAAAHDRTRFLAEELEQRAALGYPPFGRLANVLVTGLNPLTVRRGAEALSAALVKAVPDGWKVLGPAPAPLAKLKNVHRWHALVKAPADADVSPVVDAALSSVKLPEDVRAIPDVDPADLL